MSEDAPLWFDDPVPERALANYLADRATPYSHWTSWSTRVLAPEPARKGLTALDYGCGGGEFSVWLASSGWQVTASDASPCSLAACRLNVERAGLSDNVRFVQNAPPDYWAPFAGKQFDLILAKDVIEHVHDDIEFLRRLKSHLAPGGTAIIVTQNDASWNYWTQAPSGFARDPSWCGWDETHIRFYNRPMLDGKLRHTGLRAVRWRGSYLLPYRAWYGGIGGRLARGLEKLGATSLLHLPERIVGGVFPFNGLGWSIAVSCVHAEE